MRLPAAAALQLPALLLLAPLLLTLAACGVDQAQPAPVAADDHWGHLPPDPERPEQAQAPAPGRG